jgi:hypothetical protein
MRYVKMWGFAALAAAALMAFVGASSASATVLCQTPGTGSTTGTECPAGWAYFGGTEIHAVSQGSVVLTTGQEYNEFSCKHSTMTAFSQNEGSATETVGGSIEYKNLTWEECAPPIGSFCTILTTRGGSLEIHWIEGSLNGTLISNGAEITSNCNSIFGKIHCIFVTNHEKIGTLTGGNPATIDIEGFPSQQMATSSLCPAGPTLDAKYEITSPTSLYVAEGTG